MAFSSNKLLAVDWDRRHLRLVSVRPRADGVELLKAVSAPIPTGLAMDDAESLGAFIREAVRQAKIGTRHAILSIPRDQVVLNTLPLPPSNADDLPNMVRFQIAKELPFSAEQATIEFVVPDDFNPKEAFTALVAAVRNEQLEFYQRVAAEAGLTVERIGLRPHANLIAVLARAPDLADKSLLVVEVGPQLSEINIIRQGGLAFSRAASVAIPEGERLGEAHLQDSRIESLPLLERQADEASRQAVGNLMLEVLRSYEAYRATEPAASLDRIVVCGATGLESQLAEALGGRFAVPAALYMPDRALGLSPQRARELRGFSAALGLAIGQGGKGLSHFDFLHPKKAVSRRAVRLKKLPIAVVTACLFVASGVGVYRQMIYPLQQQRKTLSADVDAKKKIERNIEEFQAQLDVLEMWQASEQYWPELLVQLTDLMPSEQDVVVMRADFETRRPPRKSNERPSGVRLRLRTAALGGVNEVTAKLRDAGFREVKAGKEVPFASRQQEVYHFDTGVEAELPPRTKPSKEERDTELEAVEEEMLPPSSPDGLTPTTTPGAPAASEPVSAMPEQPAGKLPGQPEPATEAPPADVTPDEVIAEPTTGDEPRVFPPEELPPPPIGDDEEAAADLPEDQPPPSDQDAEPQPDDDQPSDRPLTPPDAAPPPTHEAQGATGDLPDEPDSEDRPVLVSADDDEEARLEDELLNAEEDEREGEIEVEALPPPPPPLATTQAARLRDGLPPPGSTPDRPNGVHAGPPRLGIATTQPTSGPTTRPATTRPAGPTTRPAREGLRSGPERLRSRRDRVMTARPPAPPGGAVEKAGAQPPAAESDEGGAR